MSTILETATAAVATLAGQGPQHRYRQSVFDNVCDPGILFDSRRIEAEWRKDRSVYEARVKACETLNVDLPKLETAAVEAAAAATEAEGFAHATVADTMSIGQLRERICRANPKLTVAKVSELANALLWLSDPSPSGRIGTLKSASIRAQGSIVDCRDRARQTLIQTAVDQQPDSTLTALSQQIEQVKDRIEKRRPVLEIEERIKRQQAECEQLAAGNIDPPIQPGPLTADSKSQWIRNAYRAGRRKLDELFTLVAAKPNAVAANARDGEELQRLTTKMSEARERVLKNLPIRRP